MISLNDLCNTQLYKSEVVVVNDGWEAIFNRRIE